MSTLKRYTGGNWEVVGAPVKGGSGSTLAYAEVTANQSAIPTTFTALTGLSVTVTVPEGRRIKISAHGIFQKLTADGFVILAIYQDGALAGEDIEAIGMLGTSRYVTLNPSVVLSPSAGTHTYQLYARAENNTAQMEASAATPSYILVEDITGTSLPYNASNIPVGVLARAEVTTAHTGIDGTFAAPVDFTNVPPLTISVPAGRVIRISVKAHLTSSVLDERVAVLIKEGNTILDGGWARMRGASGEELVFSTVLSPTAGSHTYKLSGYTEASATMSWHATTVDVRGYFMIEDITPTPAPSTGAPGSTLGYTHINSTSLSVAAASIVDIPGLEIAVTVPEGRRLRITAKGIGYANTVPARPSIVIREGGTTLGNFESMATVAGLGVGLHAEAIITPSAGTHTYKASFSSQNNTSFLYADANLPVYILIEDITGSVWPAGSAVTLGMLASEQWINFIPVLSQGVSTDIAKTVQYSRYTKIGRTVHWQFRLAITGTGTASSSIQLILPITPANVADTIRVPIGTAQFFNASANQFHPLLPTLGLNGGNGMIFTPAEVVVGLGAQFFGLSVMTEAVTNGDLLSGTVTYEAAS